MFHHRRTWLGLLVTVVGIILARVVPTIMGPGEWATLIYLLGVALALSGLVLVASAIQVTSVSVIPCPHCFLANSTEADLCVRCASPLPKGGEGPEKQGRLEDIESWRAP